ncbi:hypothetical protein GCM10023189_59700 [Nibrella saemangeumensis]|uniref:HTH cro/C1-type domain-containing protein n=1 Tax=Nibrella saemangeumensis TaxID=1084526 RepID=A0ABP8NSL1_9BACT
MSIVSNNIKYLRRLNGLTQEQFARRIGIKRSLLGAYEEARANPNLDNLMSIARAFNTTVDQLLKQDLRKIRETPDLSMPLSLERNAGERSGAERASVTAPPPIFKEPAVEAPQPLAKVLEKYYRGPDPIRAVAQRVLPRPVSFKNGLSMPNGNGLRSPEPPLAFNNVYEKAPIFDKTVLTGRSDNLSPARDEGGSQPAIPYVQQFQFGEYQQRHQQSDYLSHLPTLRLPLLPAGHYRAFEAGPDFTFPGALLIGQFVRNWFDITDGRLYVLMARHHGLLCRRVFNQVKLKGVLLLTDEKSATASREVPLSDVLEVWEVKAFFSQHLPEPGPSLDRIRQLADELRYEVDRLK